MSKQIILPSGTSVTLKDPKTLLMKDRNKVLQIANDQDGIMQAVALQNGLIAVLIQEWSFDLILPSIRIDSLGELTPMDYETLATEAANAQEYLFPNMTKTDASEADPKATTAN